jgi:nitrite reductase/ring-hydroxylating ferredoxin subunit
MSIRTWALRTLTRSELGENGVVAFEAAGTHYLVAEIEGELRAFAVFGPAVHDLDRTVVAEGRVRCPMHGWAIDPDSGRCGAAELCRYDSIPVAVDGDEVRVLPARTQTP